jgi:hypothetical protein
MVPLPLPSSGGEQERKSTSRRPAAVPIDAVIHRDAVIIIIVKIVYIGREFQL